ncbi:hypothetical protein PHYBOEH_003907 [Phytophthora boehmeriae]|uniref:Uncharacterized protein n=1 Tax=Phytophthora boehmeriae TaxID=109152 RepID=A0A8T1WPH7_9STRA|nr:hypothetical protein PHYBOEH_003907 [Phytophthora boehmeriae]
MARGGGLRVGRIVSDARGNNNARQSPSLVVQEEERRIQDELIEILTVKLANKEKEIEMLKVKQSDVNRELGGYDHQMQQQQEEHARMMTEVATTNHELQRQVQALTTEIQQRQEVEVVVKQLEEEKCALEAKQRALVKALKGANMRAVDVEKKWSKRSRVEDQLTLQLEESRKENVDLKARKGQMSSQAKYLQARIANLENAYATQERKLEDATVELENARKYCRDCQFRTKQLQEENVFLKNRKIATEVPSTASEQLDKSFLAPGSPTESQSVKAEHERDDEVPCWMKE